MIYVSLDGELNSALNDIQITGDDFQLTLNTQFEAQQNACNARKEARNRKGMSVSLVIKVFKLSVQMRLRVVLKVGITLNVNLIFTVKKLYEFHKSTIFDTER